MSKVVCDVTCSEAAKPDQTRVSITYDVTSLTPEGAAFVKELEATYSEFLEDGRQQIITLAALDAGRASRTTAGSMTAAPDLATSASGSSEDPLDNNPFDEIEDG